MRLRAGIRRRFAGARLAGEGRRGLEEKAYLDFERVADVIDLFGK